MHATRRRTLLAIAAAGLGLAVAAAVTIRPPRAGDAAAPYFTAKGVAIRGYDPVAYFTQARPVEGDAAITTVWEGATWRFATAEHRDLFIAAPTRYAPQYGGFCAWAAAGNYFAPVDPTAWRIVEGRLYLNYDKSVQRMWEKDVPGFVAKGDANWPGLLARIAEAPRG
jgi:hypothetical protein